MKQPKPKAPATQPATAAEPEPRGKTNPGLVVYRIAGEPGEKATARTFLRPTVKAAMTISDIIKPSLGDSDLMSLVEELGIQVKAASAGNLGRAEGILMAQAHTLDALFNDLVRRSMTNAGAGYLQAADTYMKLALKAQSQCRCSLEGLAEIKNPRAVAFVKQANIANTQQVNNGGPEGVSRQSARAGAGENSLIPPNKLLERTHGERLDFGTAGEAAGAHPDLATVGPIDGATNGRREGESSSERR